MSLDFDKVTIIIIIIIIIIVTIVRCLKRNLEYLNESTISEIQFLIKILTLIH
jgi:hypothetical protein